MRDPKRIEKFCKELEELWSKVPDWRFGQLLDNVIGQECEKDIFYVEDDEMIGYFKKYFEERENRT